MRQFISFYLEQEHYALDILLAKEISLLSDISPVPESPEHLLGIMNLRGQILTIVDPQFFLIQQSQVELSNKVLIILKTKLELNRAYKLNRKTLTTDGIKDPLALLVDKIGETLTVAEEDILPPLPNMVTENKDFMAGLISQNNEFIIVLALDVLLKRILTNQL